MAVPAAFGTTDAAFGTSPTEGAVGTTGAAFGTSTTAAALGPPGDDPVATVEAGCCYSFAEDFRKASAIFGCPMAAGWATVEPGFLAVMSAIKLPRNNLR